MSGMDKGAFIQGGYTIRVGDGGSFIAMQGERDNERIAWPAHRGFTNYIDLLAWLKDEHEALVRDRGDNKNPTTKT